MGCSNYFYGGKATIVRYSIGDAFISEKEEVCLTIRNVIAVKSIFIEKEQKTINDCMLIVGIDTLFSNYIMDYCQLKIAGVNEPYEDFLIDYNEELTKKINPSFLVNGEQNNYEGEFYFCFTIEYIKGD